MVIESAHGNTYQLEATPSRLYIDHGTGGIKLVAEWNTPLGKKKKPKPF